MYVNPKMKLNKFVQVAIPKNSEFFRRFNGNLPVPSNGQYTGDDVVPSGLTKVEQISLANRLNDQYLDREAQEVKEGAD